MIEWIEKKTETVSKVVLKEQLYKMSIFEVKIIYIYDQEAMLPVLSDQEIWRLKFSILFGDL